MKKGERIEGEQTRVIIRKASLITSTRVIPAPISTDKLQRIASPEPWIAIPVR
jgi:hypothetical protein